MLLIGPGGVLALVAAVWGWVWSSFGTLGRPWRSWFTTALSFATVMTAAPAVTTQSWLLVQYGFALSVLEVAARQEVLDGAERAYRALAVGLIAVAVFAVSLARSRRYWGDGGRLSVLGTTAAALMVGANGVSWITMAVFHVVHLSAGAVGVAPTSVQVGAGVLLIGVTSGWLALSAAAGWGLFRAASLLWDRVPSRSGVRPTEAPIARRERRQRRRRA